MYYDKSSKGAEAYLSLTYEFLDRNNIEYKKPNKKSLKEKK